jgi:hypothetical protein
MIRIIIEVLLALALVGSGTFGWMQYKSVGASTSQVSELEDKTAEVEKKLEATEEELKEAKEAVEAAEPLKAKVQELEAVKTAFSGGEILKDYTKEVVRKDKLVKDNKVEMFKVKVVVTKETVQTMAVVAIKEIVLIMAVVEVIKAIVQTIIVQVKPEVEQEEMFLKQRSKKKSIKKQFKIRSRKHKLNYLAKVVEVRA